MEKGIAQKPALAIADCGKFSFLHVANCYKIVINP